MLIRPIIAVYCIMSSKRQPEFVSEGAYGCVHRPSLHCEPDVDMDYTNKVSKLMTTDNAKKELQEYVLIDRADPNHHFYLGKPKTCKLGIIPPNREPVQKCKSIKDQVMKKPADYSLIILQDGGMDLNFFASMMADLPVTPINTQRIEMVWIELRRMFLGIQSFLKHGLVHYDMKDQNIVYNEAKRRCNFIDFGLMKQISEIKQLCLANQYKYANFHWSYPFENRFLNEKDFEYIVNLPYEDVPTKTKKTMNGLHTFLQNITQETHKQDDHWLSIFYYQIHATSAEKQEHFTVFHDFLANKIKQMTYSQFVDKCVQTFDVYGLGLTLLQFLHETRKFMDREFYVQAKALFHQMITPDLTQRLYIQDALTGYDALLDANDMFTRNLPPPPPLPPTHVGKSKSSPKVLSIVNKLSKSIVPSANKMKQIMEMDIQPVPTRVVNQSTRKRRVSSSRKTRSV